MLKRKKMKLGKIILNMCTAVAVALVATSTLNAATEDGAASVDIVDFITITESRSLNFGDIASGTLASTITIDSAAAENRTLTGGDAQLVTGAALEASGSFLLTGSIANTVSVSVADGASDLGPSNEIVFVPFASNCTTGVTMPISCFVGGTITVPAALPAGTYSNPAAYVITVTYE
jgi:hypothetical protein